MVIISLVVSAISGLLGFGITVGEKETRRQRHLVWIGLVAGFLYVATAALCERLNVAALREPYWRDIGLSIFAAGCLVRLWAIAALGRFHSGLVTIQKDHKLIETGPYKRLRHPSYFGIWLIAGGLPLVFGTWFPLLALPGIFVTLKWRIDDEEALLTEHFGEDFENYKKNRRRMIPFLY
jgi:protein-S-isoprenylcysteine O-methyltransferase Ste14